MLIDLVLSDDALTYAWLRVKENGGGAGVDGVNLVRFGEDLLIRLAKLRAQVRQGTYLPDPLLRIELPREGRAPRLLAVPTIRDRVLQTAVTQVLNPILETTFEAESFGYRAGRSVRDAVAAVIQARDDGFTWVVDADIEAFFDHIPHGELLAKLTTVLPDASLHALIAAWLSMPIKTATDFVRSDCGVPQGSPLSPLLANLYLDAFDEAMTINDTLRLVRYADDFVILARSNAAAEAALLRASDWLSAAGLSINQDKTRIISFEQGFVFLSVRFQGNAVWAEDETAERWLLPVAYQKNPTRKTKSFPALARQKCNPPHPVIEPRPSSTQTPPHFDEPPAPLLRTLYLGEAGVYLRQAGGRIVAMKDDTVLLSLPHEKIDQIFITEEGAISFGVLRTLMGQGASVLLQSQAGEPIGMFLPTNDTRIHLRVLQHERVHDPAFNLNIARAIVAGKIANSRLLLRRYYRFRPNGESPVEPLLRELQAKAQQAENIETLRGFEGVAARHYFDTYRELLPESWKNQFVGRSRQPPHDPVNALLSYGYGVLYQNVLTLIAARGLETHLGHLHALHDGHPALVSDLVEEFRALIVDAVVLKLTLDHPFEVSDFTLEAKTDVATPFCRISKPLRHQLIARLEEKLQSPVTHPILHTSGDYRRMIRTQISQYIQVLEDPAAGYHAFVLR